MASTGINDLIVTMASRVGVFALTLILQAVLAWMLGPEGRGEYAVCLTFSMLASAVFLFGMDWSLSHYSANGTLGRRQSAMLGLVVPMVLGLVAYPVLYLVIDLPFAFFEQVGRETFELSILWAISLVFHLVAWAMLRGHRMFSVLAIVALAKIGITLAGAFCLLHFTDLGVAAPILSDTVSGYVMGLVACAYLWFPGQGPTSVSWPVIRKAVNYGSRAFPGAIGNALNLRLTLIALTFYVGTEEIGYFALALALLTQLGTVSDVVGSVIMPRNAADKDGRPELTGFAARCVSSVTFFLATLLVFAADWLIPLLFSADFLPAVGLLWILFPAIWLRAVSKIIFHFFNGIHKPHVVSINTLLSIVMQVVLLVLLLPNFGATGAAVAMSVAVMISFSHIAYIYSLHTETRFPKLLLLRNTDVRDILARVGFRSCSCERDSEDGQSN